MSSNIIGPLPKKSDAPSEKIKKWSGPLPNKSDVPSEKVEKSSGGLDHIKNLLVITIGMVDKKGLFKRLGGKRNKKCGGRRHQFSYFRRKKIDTDIKTEKSQTFKNSPYLKKINPKHITQ